MAFQLDTFQLDTFRFEVERMAFQLDTFQLDTFVFQPGGVVNLDDIADGAYYKRMRVGLGANKPAPGIVDSYYFASDTKKLYRDTGTAWEIALSLTFKDLRDVPKDYTGQGNRIVTVKPTEDGLAFTDTLTPVSDFLGLIDTPNTYTGQGGKLAAVNSAETALEFKPLPSGLLAPVVASPNATSWNAMPAAETEIFGATNSRCRIDLTNYSQARLVARVFVNGAANAELRVQYSTDETTWAYLDGVGGPKISISGMGTIVSAWVNMVTGAKADVFIRVVGINGDGIANPSFGNIFVEFK
ncbi:MAG TPA: hypothetical protein ACFYD3_07355 [Candidatus Hypogeohydataceae bacterium YC41]